MKAIVADDVLENQEILSNILFNIGAEVVRAEDGKEVLERIKDQIPDIVFMDIRMPVMDGMQAAKHIIEDYGADKIKLIAVTASALEHERDKFKKAGFHDFIIKPFLVENIFQCIKKHLNIEFDYKMETRANGIETNSVKNCQLEHALTGDQILNLRKSAEIGNITEIENSLAEIFRENEQNEKIVKEMSNFMNEYDMEGFLSFLGEIDHAE